MLEKFNRERHLVASLDGMLAHQLGLHLLCGDWRDPTPEYEGRPGGTNSSYAPAHMTICSTNGLINSANSNNTLKVLTLSSLMFLVS